MDGNKSLLDDKTRNDIDYLDKRDDANPNIEPYGNLHVWEQLHKTNDDKDKVGHRIQLGSKIADGVCFSCYPTVGYVG